LTAGLLDELGVRDRVLLATKGGLSDAKELAEKHPAFQEIAAAHGVSAQQVTLAWELAPSLARG
jgi:aryl-alcohol dehydrogenase-like predicted oxidoreductase